MNDNKLIAEFMTGEIQPDTWTWNYHDSWDSLMPVVEKIVGEDSSCFHVGSPGYASSTDNWEFSMLDDQINGQNSRASTLIEATYNTVVKYIKTKQL